MKFSILLLLTLSPGFNACPALGREAKDHNERTLSAPIKDPLRQSRNPNCFQDASGTPLILCGSQTWNTLQDWGSNGAVRALNFDAFVSFLNAHGQNFTLLWCTELPKFRSLPTTESSPPDFTVSPFPWLRIGPGLATDGGLKFNLTKFDPAYFDRLRARVQALSSTGIYVGVYLFSGEFLLRFRCSTDGYSRKLNLANVAPSSTLCSTHYCLAQTPSVGAEYLAYAPSGGSFTMDLSAMANSRKLAVEWFNPASGETISQNSIAAGSSSRSFSVPFTGEAVLYLVDTEGHK